jgi:uncharacterized CHY-type Zn-finger protein
MAQAWLEETLPEVVVISSSQKTTCPNCYMSVEKWCFQTHLELDCPKRTVVCGFCNQSYIFYESHTCTSVCALCHKPSNECTCEGALGIGHYHSGGSSGGGGGGTNPNSGGVGHGSSGNTGQFSNESGKKVSVGDLKYKSGVRLVSYTKLPDKLHPQTRKMECVLRAYAFMAELKGYDYDNVFEAMDKIAKKKNIDPENEGIPFSLVSTFFKDYCQIGTGYNDPSNIASCINKGEPVAVVTCTSPYHMVTIIGYDGNNYYTASGDSSGDAIIYSKDQLTCFDYFYIFNTTNIPLK